MWQRCNFPLYAELCAAKLGPDGTFDVDLTLSATRRDHTNGQSVCHSGALEKVTTTFRQPECQERSQES